ncbi:head decoration protein [Pseudomonas sp. 2023EL-01195]|uniref:head decoration protein n=1 Tax=Pseudomonas sp. 2023EL-01195 TaxID=3088134 RepID=UPI00296B2D01|nr:head decoration protein [Pseudomonas sp. 2023EL-01195]MDW3716671.1 head decoration protein [Pseudomonas sp. 2023EL-01195]
MKQTNTLDLNGFKAINLADGVNPQDAVTRSQLDAAIQGFAWKAPVRAATTANITLSGTQTIDGVALVAGDRVLVKNQSTASGNGIYLAASGSWTRSTDFDTAAEMLGAAVFVSEGTTQGNQQWKMTTDAPITVGTTAIVWEQVGGGSSYTAGSGITITGGVIAVDTSVTARKMSATIGDGTATTITVTHNLNTQDVVVSVREASTNAGVIADWVANGVNTIQLTFGTAPTSGQYRVTVTG